VLKNVSFAIRPESVTTLMGANACGKTTLLLLMTKNLRPDNGRVLLDGRDITGIRLKDFARSAAIVHQKNSAPDDLSVADLVAYGRIPYSSMFRSWTAEDKKMVIWALEATGLKDIACQTMGTLSGGQRQRAFIAMALAQGSKLLFLDEPTTFLDMRYQVETLRLIRDLNTNHGLTILMVLHDVNQALLYSDEVIGLKDGAVLAQGPPGDVITEDAVFAMYGIRLPVREEGGRRWVLPA
jgi:iron complex transport system ATP-binding protein